MPHALLEYIYVYIISTQIYTNISYCSILTFTYHLIMKCSHCHMLPCPQPKVYIRAAMPFNVPFMSFSWYPWHFSSLPLSPKMEKSRWQASQVCHGVRDAPGQHGSNQQRDDADYEENDRGCDARLLCRMIPWLMLTEFRLPKCLPFC